MMDNYPPGAANDPRAPYNQPQDEEVEVMVTQTLSKETVLLVEDPHTFVEYDYDPLDGFTKVGITEYNDDLEEYYRNQDKTPLEIIKCCEKIAKQLTADGHRFYAGICISSLLEACDGWEEDEFKVED